MLGGDLAEVMAIMTKVLTYFETGLRPNECISDSRISSPGVPCRPLILRPRGVHHSACIAVKPYSSIHYYGPSVIGEAAYYCRAENENHAETIAFLLNHFYYYYYYYYYDFCFNFVDAMLHDFIVGLTSVSPLEQVPVPWQYDVCGRYIPAPWHQVKLSPCGAMRPAHRQADTSSYSWSYLSSALSSLEICNLDVCVYGMCYAILS